MDRSPVQVNPKSKIQNPKSRRAFTLIELLMVITIIGMLVALVSVAAVRAIGTARNAQITTEIGLLDAAMQTYKNDTAGAYPPDCSLLSTPASGTPTAQDVQNRQNRILAHFRKAFPRLIVAGGYGPASTQGTLQYMSINAFSQSTQYSALFSGTTTPNGTSQWGDFDNMDPAEALVFWLGGFAIPYSQGGKWTYTLIGFAGNKVGNASSAGPNANGPNSGFGPFNLDVQARDKGPFEFSPDRLGDADGDGWPEYYPPVGDIPQPPGALATVASPMPPYVYFDAVSYGYYSTPTSDLGQGSWNSPPWTAGNPPPLYPASAVYPSSSGAGIQPSAYAAPGQWGVALPYAKVVPTTGSASITWVEPNGFQIICAGLDRMYWFNPTGGTFFNQLRDYPNGFYYGQGDLDNLTCFTTSTLQSAQP